MRKFQSCKVIASYFGVTFEMAKRRYIASPVKQKIVEAIERGMSQRQTAAAFGLPSSSVSSIIAHYKKAGTVHRDPKSGRPRATTKRMDKTIVRLSKQDPTKTAVDIQHELEEFHGISVSSDTVKRRLKDAGLNAQQTFKKKLRKKAFKKKPARSRSTP